jgi:predicted MFS family arabinose efflux permease
MPLERYRAVLRAPGVPGLLVVGFLSRGPVIAVSAVLTLHTVLTLHRDYASAGLAATALTAATAVGAPWRGRVVDQHGLRRALLPSIVIGGGTWLVAPWVGYLPLLGLAVVGGVFGLPSFAVIRQALSVAVGPDQRRSALALDSMSVELSFMTGPAIAVVGASTWSTKGVLVLVGVAQILSGLALWLLNPRVRSEPLVAAPAERAAPADGQRTAEPRSGRHRLDHRVGRRRAHRTWFSPALLAVFVSGAGAALVLSGSEVAVVAQLRHLGHLPFTGVVFVVWGVTSMLGGFVYGALRREISPPVVLLGLALLTLPIGLASGPVTVALLIGLAGLFCAPALTATSTALTKLVAEESRGEALGWQGTAMTIGSGAGAPLAGVAADHTGSAGGYLAAGLAGVGLALLAWALLGTFRVRTPAEAPAGPAVPAVLGEPSAGRSAGPSAGPAPAVVQLPRNTEARVRADTLTD